MEDLTAFTFSRTRRKNCSFPSLRLSFSLSTSIYIYLSIPLSLEYEKKLADPLTSSKLNRSKRVEDERAKAQFQFWDTDLFPSQLAYDRTRGESRPLQDFSLIYSLFLSPSLSLALSFSLYILFISYLSLSPYLFWSISASLTIWYLQRYNALALFPSCRRFFILVHWLFLFRTKSQIKSCLLKVWKFKVLKIDWGCFLWNRVDRSQDINRNFPFLNYY